MLCMFPHLGFTVELLFLPQTLPTLHRLTSRKVTTLLLSLWELLHCPALPTASWGDLTLCAIISLLYSISSLVRTVPGLESLPLLVLELQEQCARHYYTSPYIYWRETRDLLLLLWTNLIIA